MSPFEHAIVIIFFIQISEIATRDFCDDRPGLG